VDARFNCSPPAVSYFFSKEIRRRIELSFISYSPYQYQLFLIQFLLSASIDLIRLFRTSCAKVDDILVMDSNLRVSLCF